jgi:hypothetical protein
MRCDILSVTWNSTLLYLHNTLKHCYVCKKSTFMTECVFIILYVFILHIFTREKVKKMKEGKIKE